MKFALLSVALLVFSFSQAQLPATYIQAGAGPAMLYDDGAMPGVSFKAAFSRYFSGKFSWTVGLGGSVNDDVIGIFYRDPASGQMADGSIRETAGGMQVTAEIGYSLIRNRQHELIVKFGTLGRYESSSRLKGFAIFFATPSGYPDYRIINKPKQRTFTGGGSITTGYNYTFTNNITLGIEGALQYHTNGTSLSRIGLTIGKRL
jgi:hypothetical protein